MADKLLDIQHLGVHFAIGGLFDKSTLRAVHDVHFSVDRGDIVALVGESGSGKSTIAKLICRLEKPTSGKILLDGKDVLETEPHAAGKEYRKRVQMIFQYPFGSLNPVHTVAYHLSRPLQLHQIIRSNDLRPRILQLLETVGLRPAEDFIDKFPHSLSGGQRQRVAIARALATEPDLICADEPTSMLDVSIRMDILRLLTDLRKEQQTAFIFVTHDLAAARQLADRILVLYAGQLVEEATSDDLIADPKHPYAQLLLAAAPQQGGSLDTPLPAKPGAPKNVDPQPGCAFAERCSQAMDVCRQQTPGWTWMENKRRVRCYLYGDTRADEETTK
ncbi:MAG: ABC transporter ATP-binding protein [Desulfuromonas sp.]|nr:MAG: ABC transporter ATP-binding protein [Desulfuromonas sp.]